MASTGVVDAPRGLVIDAIPDREIEPVLLLHLKRVVEGAKHLTWHPEISLGKGLRAQGIHGGDREQGRADSVAADVEQVKGEMVVIEPVIAERIATQLGRGNEPPVGLDVALS